MEMRSLTRCLRSRPSVLSTGPRPSMLNHNHCQFLTSRTLRFSSSDSGSDSSSSPKANFAPIRRLPFNNRLQSQNRPPRNNMQDIDDTINMLSFSASNKNTARTASLADQRSGKQSSLPSRDEARRNDLNKIKLKLGPVLGRQVDVRPENGQDLNSALRSLGMLLSSNKVRTQARDQKFHVRRGQRIKNLRIRRWRNLFKFSFDATVGRIKRMRTQGW